MVVLDFGITCTFLLMPKHGSDDFIALLCILDIIVLSLRLLDLFANAKKASYDMIALLCCYIPRSICNRIPK